MSVVRRAAKRAVGGEWRAGSSGAFVHTSSGHWGQVAFRVEPDFRPLYVTCTAGVLSPYLMRVINRLNPERYPPPDFIAAHAQTEWFQGVRFDEAHSGDPESADPRVADPCADDVGQSASDVLLGPGCAPAWVEHRIKHLISRTTPLLSDLALRDWQLEKRWPDGDRWPAGARRNLRYAILLTRHLGLTDELPRLLALDEIEFERNRQSRPIDPSIQAHFDRKRSFDPMWSHVRFAKWLASAKLD
jgi:hypothetical protein